MKKVILSFVMFAFALSLGVGSSVMFAEDAAADMCINEPGVIYVKTSEVCWLSKYTEGVVYLIYDGILDNAGLPCLYLGTVCKIDRSSGGQTAQK